MDSHSFENVSPEAIEAVKQQLGSSAIPKEDGSIEILEHGFHAIARYNPIARQLTIDLITKPFMVPAKMVWNRLDQVIYGKKVAS